MAELTPQTISRQELFDTLARGATLVTVNNRLAAHLMGEYEQDALARGWRAWPTPDILPWTAWLQRIWEESSVAGTEGGSRLLLTGAQERCLWETVIAEQTDDPPRQMTGTVRRAMEAWQLARSWTLSLDESVFAYNDDSRAFRRWASAFEALCRAEGWISQADLTEALGDMTAGGETAVHGELVLAGFDELTPVQRRLLEALAAAGGEPRWIRPPGRAGRACRIECVDASREAEAAARWVRRRLEAEPETRLAVVVPDLAARRETLVHAFDTILAPHFQQPAGARTPRPYNISLGSRLSRWPVVGVALKLLGLLGPDISLKDAGRVLRSPYLAGWQEEAGARALLDGRLRELGAPRVTLHTLRGQARREDRPWYCPRLTACLDAWAEAAEQCPRSDSPAQWSQHFSRLLRAAGWGEGRPMSSEEYQATGAWRDLLGAFAALERVSRTLTAAEALGQLRRLAGEQTFQPRSPRVPVQVLGILEAAGMAFDGLWIMGLHDGAWPVPPRPNPFIPLPLQKETGLPHAGEERELAVARTVTDRLLACADDVVVSTPARQGEEDLRPSPLVAHLGVADGGEPALWTGETWREGIHAGGRLIALADDRAPALDMEEAAGGTRIFKLQAACPFRAFAELRLGARPLEEAQLGLDAMARGSLIHRVLEKVWQALGSSEALARHDAGALRALALEAVEETLAEEARHDPETLSGRFRAMEAERLQRHVLEWLEVERRRETPFRVLERETTHSVDAGGVRARLKVDRIDELPDGRRLVIDYKTGRVMPSQWFGPRLDEPQLPLYAMALGDVAGVLFAQLRPGAMTFRGVTAEAGLAPEVPSWERLPQTREAEDWSGVLSQWRDTVEALGRDFRAGEAAVDPKRYPGTCRYCPLGPLCRVSELTILDGEGNGEDGGDE